MKKFPSSKEIIEEARKRNPEADINELHALTYDLIREHRGVYYLSKVKDLLLRPSLADLPEETKLKVKRELLKPIRVDGKLYSNFMEETSRRISQTFQVISGNLAELCVEKELVEIGLRLNINYRRRKEHTDLIIYYPQFSGYSKKHRVEVKNVKLRERATRGLKFDGDSMIGFFDEPSEFTDNNIKIIDEHCEETDGYCYIPPVLLGELGDKVRGKRFKSNKDFSADMKRFTETGVI